MDAILEVFLVIPIRQQIDYLSLRGEDIGDNTTISSDDSTSVTRSSTEGFSMTDLNHLLAE
jgi:hypothetical protein